MMQVILSLLLLFAGCATRPKSPGPKVIAQDKPNSGGSQGSGGGHGCAGCGAGGGGGGGF